MNGIIYLGCSCFLLVFAFVSNHMAYHFPPCGMHLNADFLVSAVFYIILYFEGFGSGLSSFFPTSLWFMPQSHASGVPISRNLFFWAEIVGSRGRQLISQSSLTVTFRKLLQSCHINHTNVSMPSLLLPSIWPLSGPLCLFHFLNASALWFQRMNTCQTKDYLERRDLFTSQTL